MKGHKINRLDFPRRMLALDAEFIAHAGNRWAMVSPDFDAAAAPSNAAALDDNPFAIGGKRSFVPVLGDIVWELPAEYAAPPHAPFSAYICKAANGLRIGCVRVPHYTYNEAAVKVFEEIIARFESSTDVLVLDQVNNPGGSVFHMYGLLSALADRPLSLPKHQVSVSEDDAALAAENVRKTEAGEAVPPEERPSQELAAYSRFVLSEIAAGRSSPTNPVHLGGLAEIQPAPQHYTKKIIVLINELDFSAAELLPAILQDNRRAVLFGVGTAGAGGCVRRITIPNQLGIDYINITCTIVWRMNGLPIEDLGVQPDVSYSLTADDLQHGYAGYQQALLPIIWAVCNDHIR